MQLLSTIFGWVRQAVGLILPLFAQAADFRHWGKTAWAVIHIQYDWAGILQVFVIGLLLGWVRWRSNSTALPILLHVLFNAEATIETVIAVEYLT